MLATTKPCEYCGAEVTKTKTQQGQRKYWTCNASCANRLRIQLGHTPNWKPNPLRGQRDTRPCVVCSKPVTRYLSQVTKDRPWTCSRRCKMSREMRGRIADGTWQRPNKRRRGLSIPCPQCGTDVYVMKSGQDSPRYCSKACHVATQAKDRVVKACEVCGTELRLSPSKAGIRTCSYECMGALRTKRPLDRTHNGKPARLDRYGYVMVWDPESATATSKGWAYEHRVVAGQMLGRPLRPDEHVDHINRIKDDNRPENLQVLTINEHARKTGADTHRQSVELVEYRRRYGPLS